MFSETQMQQQEYKLSRKPHDHSFRVDRRGIGIVKQLNANSTTTTFNEKIVKAFEAVERIIDNIKDDFIDLREDYEAYKSEAPVGEIQTRAAPLDPQLESTISEDHEHIQQMLVDAITDREQLDYVNKAVDRLTETQDVINNALTKLNADMNVYRVELKKSAVKGLNGDAVANLKEEMSKVTTDITSRVDKIVHAITNDLGARVVQLKDDVSKLDKSIDARVTTKVGTYAMTIDKLQKDLKQLTTDINNKIGIKLTMFDDKVAEVDTRIADVNGKLKEANDKIADTTSSFTKLTDQVNDTNVSLNKLSEDIKVKLAEQSKTTAHDIVNANVSLRSNIIDDIQQRLTSLTSSVNKDADVKVATSEANIRADLQQKLDEVNDLITSVAKDADANLATNIEGVNMNIKALDDAILSRIDKLKASITSADISIANLDRVVNENVKSSIADIELKLKNLNSDSVASSANVLAKLETVHNELAAEINFIKDDLKTNTQSDIGLRHVVDSLVSDVATIQSNLQANSANDDETKQTLQKVREQVTELGVSLFRQLDKTDERVKLLTSTAAENNGCIDDHLKRLESNAESITTINEQLNLFESSTAKFKDEVDAGFNDVNDKVNAVNNKIAAEIANVDVKFMETAGRIESTSAKLADVDVKLVETSNKLADHVNFKPNPLDVVVGDHQTKRHVGVPVDDIGDYHLGQLVYFTVECYLYNDSEKRFVHVNDIENAYEEALGKQLVIYPSLSTNGLWKEIAGVVTGIDASLGVIQFASEGVYLVSDINDTASFGLGETIFFDPEKGIRIVADNATMTTKMRRLVLGTVTAIVDKHTVQVLK